METPVVSRLFLAIPATAILLLLLQYIRRNRGGRIAAAFAVACVVYGVVRALGVFLISESHGVPMPYRMAGSVKIGAASPMELAGWMLASALAWQAGAILVSIFGGRSQTTPVFRNTIAGALVLATLSLAVETAAIAGGWWDWSIPPPPETFLRVPPIALVDWAFVAFDFLLPFLVFSRPSSLLDRVLSLSLFPLHFLSHRIVWTPFPSFPVSVFDVAHLGIPLWVFWRAVGESAEDSRGSRVWGFYIPGLAALLVAADTVLTTVLAKQERTSVFIVPLAIVGVAALLIAWRRESAAAIEPSPKAGSVTSAVPEGARWALRIGAIVAALAFLYFVEVPSTRRRDGYAESFVAGVAKLNAGDMPGAEQALRAAIEFRPDKAEPHLVFAIVLVQVGRVADADREYAEAIRLKPELAESVQARDFHYAKSYNEGMAKITAGDMVGGEAAMRVAVGLRPENAEAHMAWSVALFNTGRTDEARREYSAAIRINPALAQTPPGSALRDVFARMP